MLKRIFIRCTFSGDVKNQVIPILSSIRIDRILNNLNLLRFFQYLKISLNACFFCGYYGHCKVIVPFDFLTSILSLLNLLVMLHLFLIVLLRIVLISLALRLFFLLSTVMWKILIYCGFDRGSEDIRTQKTKEGKKERKKERQKERKRNDRHKESFQNNISGADLKR